MLVSTPGILGSGAPPPPPPGEWISSVCSGPDSPTQGPVDYYDANNNVFNGTFNLWEQFTDGLGGYYWTNYGANLQDNKSPNTACWLPAYFYAYNNNNTWSFYWYGCGNEGNFDYGSSYGYSYYNGDGTTTTGGGGGNWYNAGYLIYDSGCCQVYFDGTSGYYVSDNCGGGGGCTEYGTWLGNGCNNNNGYDASGQYFEGAWTYGSFYADGNCGTYFELIGENTDGCYYPAGWKFDYTSGSSSFSWTVYESNGNAVAYGDYTYATSWYSSAVANGSGGTYSDGYAWEASLGDYISNGTYFDYSEGQSYWFYVYYDGSGGFYVDRGVY